MDFDYHEYFFEHNLWEDIEERHRLSYFVRDFKRKLGREERKWWEHGLPVELYSLVISHPYLINPLMYWCDTPQGEFFWAKISVKRNENGSFALTPEALEILNSWAGVDTNVEVEEIEWV